MSKVFASITYRLPADVARSFREIAFKADSTRAAITEEVMAEWVKAAMPNLKMKPRGGNCRKGARV